MWDRSALIVISPVSRGTWTITASVLNPYERRRWHGIDHEDDFQQALEEARIFINETVPDVQS